MEKYVQVDTKRFKKERIKYKFTQAELAKELGLSEKTISRIETGEARMHINNATKAANIFKIDIMELLKKDIPRSKQEKCEKELGRLVIEAYNILKFYFE